jgi:hypothetical protein
MTDNTPPEDKQRTNAIETLALSGVVVNELENGTYMASSSMWCSARFLPDLPTLVGLARHVSEVPQ